MNRFFLVGFMALTLISLTMLNGLAQTTSTTFSNPANNGLPANTITLPVGVTSVTVQVWGGGGGGGNSNNTNGNGGGGGGGGAFAQKVISGLTSGIPYTINVGAGGSGGLANSTADAFSGGDSWFLNSSTVMAKGGSFGIKALGGGLGGLGIGTSIGDVGFIFAGGNGGASGSAGGGGGGSSAGTLGNGLIGSTGATGTGTGTATGGIATVGGGGGNGGNGAGGTIASGTSGNTPGGGGGGSNDLAASTGGNGANGQVIISYTLPNTTGLSASVSNGCTGGSVVTVSSSNLATGVYTITYNVSGTNTVASTTATLNFTAGSPGTGTFTTAALPTIGVANVVNITRVTNSLNNFNNVTVSTPAFSTVAAPDLSSLSATASSVCGVSTVTVSSSTLITGTYAVTYNVSGTNTVSSTTATMSFTSGSPGTGTFNTAVLSSAGSNNVVNITAIKNNATTCSSAAGVSTPAFANVLGVDVSNFTVTGTGTTTGSGANILVTSTTLADGVYTVTYNMTSGTTNAAVSGTATLNFASSATSFFTTATLSASGTGNRVTVSSIASVSSGCSSVVGVTSAAFTTTARTVYVSANPGAWNIASTWVQNSGFPGVNDDVIINHAVDANGKRDCNNLTVSSTGYFTSNQDLDVFGDLIVNGSTNLSGNTLKLRGDNKLIGGSGYFYASTVEFWDRKFIPQGSNLFVSGVSLALVNVLQPPSITNYGKITFASALTGGTWNNGVNATLIYQSTTFGPTLNAYTTGNTVDYNASSAQNVKTPSTPPGGLYGTYYNLTASGTGVKSFAAGVPIQVNGDVNITSSSILGATGINTNQLYVHGDWINKGNFNQSTGTVFFEGNADQSITSTLAVAGETFYKLTINNTGGVVTLNDNVIASNTLTMTSGNIDANGNTLTLGTIAGSLNTLSPASPTSHVIGRFERYLNAASGTDYYFPVGSATSNNRYARLNFAAAPNGSVVAEFHTTPAPGDVSPRPLLTTDPSDAGVTIYNTFVDGYWSLTTSTVTAPFDLDLYANGFSGFAINASTRLLTRANSGSAWFLDGANVAAVGSIIKRSGITTLSGEYCLGSDNPCVPPVTSVITGNASICLGATGESYQVDLHATTTYTWSVVNGTIASGQGTNQITVNWASTGGAGKVTVYENNGCTNSGTQSLTVTPTAATPTAFSSGRASAPQNTGIALPYTITAIPGVDEYVWTVSGGTISSGQGTNSIQVLWGNSGTGSVCVATKVNSCSTVITSPALCMSVEIYSYVVSKVSGGSWIAGTTWSCNCTPQFPDNIVILATHKVLIPNGTTAVSAKHLTILSGGQLEWTIGSTAVRTITVNGDLSVDGTGLTGTGAITRGGASTGVFNINMAGSSPFVYGIGSINPGTSATGAVNFLNAVTIDATAIINQTGGSPLNVGQLGQSITTTNDGSYSLDGNLVGLDPTSTWTNTAGSTLSVGGALLSQGVLDASAAGNTVNYKGIVAQVLKVPSLNQYANLSINGILPSVAGTMVTAPLSTTLSVSENWVNNGNGISGIYTGFNPNSGTIEFNGNTTISGTAKTSFNNLLVTGTLTSSSATIEVGADFTNNGTFNHNNGTINFNGTTQSVLGSSTTDFYNVNISNLVGGKVSLNVNANLLGSMSLPLSTSNFDADGSSGTSILTLKSTSANSAAAIGVINNAATFTGNITVQRDMGSALAKENRYISMPVTGMVLNTDLSELNLKNGGFIYNEKAVGNQNIGWSQTMKNYAFQSGRGFVTYDSPKSWEVRGPLTTGSSRGDVVFDSFLSYTPTGRINADGWNLVGNPYPSAINWNTNASDWTSEGIDPTIYVPDVAGNVYQTWNRSSNIGSLPGGNIALGQAFWIKANNSVPPKLTIKESAKRGSGTFYRKSTDEIPVLKLALSSGDVTDFSLLMLHHDATPNYDQGIDAFKLEGNLMGISMISEDDQKLVHYATNSLNEKDIPLNVMASREGTFTLSFDSEMNFDQFSDLYLIDKFTNLVHPLSAKTPYEFKVTQNVSTKEGRFYLSKNSNPPAWTEARIFIYPNPASDNISIEVIAEEDVEVHVYSMSGANMMNATIRADSGIAEGTIDVKDLPAGLYLFKINVDGHTQVSKVVKR